MKAALIALGALIAAPVAAQAPVGVDQLGWMVGTWGQAGGASVRETWLAPLGGQMLGASQTAREGRAPFHEFMRIEAEGGALGFTATIPGQPPVTFPLASGSAEALIFENKTHDFPQRVIYRRCGEQLCAAIEGRQDGKDRRESWTYSRISPP
jgi:hypothetical protein